MNKRTAWDWCSKYCRLRDAIKYCEDNGIDLGQFNDPTKIPVKCATCGTVKSWKYMDAGHCFSRGIGGGSGVYWDERNIAAQCKPQNAWEQGAPDEFREYVKEQYGQEVLDELALKHRIPQKENITAIGTYYKLEYQKLLKELT